MKTEIKLEKSEILYKQENGKLKFRVEIEKGFTCDETRTTTKKEAEEFIKGWQEWAFSKGEKLDGYKITRLYKGFPHEKVIKSFGSLK